MPAIQTTIWLPEELLKTVQALAADEGDANAVVLLLRMLDARLQQLNGPDAPNVGLEPMR